MPLLSYSAKSAVLQWVPIEKRKKLVKAVPCLGGLDERLPYRLPQVELSEKRRANRVVYVSFSLSNVSCVAFLRADGSVRRIATKIRGRRKAIWNKVMDVAEEERVTRDTFVTYFFNEFLARPGTVIENLVQKSCTDFVSRFERCATPPKVIELTASDVTSQDVLAIVAWKTTLECRTGSLFQPIFDACRNQNRPIGSLLVVQNSSTRPETIFALRQMFEEFRHLNPRRGVVPNRLTDAFGGPNVRTATFGQCIVVEMEHADLIVHICRGSPSRGLLSTRQVYQLVPKRSVPICEPEDWMVNRW